MCLFRVNQKMLNVSVYCVLGILCMFVLTSCDNKKTPQDLRAKFESQLKSGFSIMLPLVNTESRLPKDAPKCLAKAASQTFSDEEVRLIIDSSFSERMQNAESIMAIQQKIESPQFMLRFFKNCGY
ncbi:hypothetical protein [Helicobacter sp. T3_23-1056]